jgi:hypothetical protein
MMMAAVAMAKQLGIRRSILMFASADSATPVSCQGKQVRLAIAHQRVRDSALLTDGLQCTINDD